MISKEASLATRMGWVATDVENLIDATEQSLNIYLNDNDAKEALYDAMDALHNIRGVIDVVGAAGAVMLVREINFLVKAIHEDNVSKPEQAKEALANATVSLRDYLQHLQEGYADLPVVILPLLNDLRAARDADLLSDHLVFLPEDSEIDREDMGVEDFVPLADNALEQACVKLRYHFQKSLVGWYNDDATEQSLNTIQRVSKNLIRINERIRLRSLWWITMALAEALSLKKLESSVAVKLLMGRLEREIRKFSELKEAEYAESLPDELIKNLLYYVGLAEKGGETLDAVKAAYQLDMHLPQGETLEQLREYYQAPSNQLWKAVSNSLNKDVLAISHALETLDVKDDEAGIAIQQLAEQVNKMSGTLSVIGLSNASDIFLDLSQQLQGHVETPKNLLNDERMQYAESLLKLKEVLNEYAESGNDITEVVFSAKGQFTAEAVRQTHIAMLDALRSAQQHVAEFFANESAFFQLDHATDELTKVHGAVQLLGRKTSKPLFEGTLKYVQQLQENKYKPDDKEQALLADVLTVLEAVIVTQQQRESDHALLIRGYDDLRQLQETADTLLLQPELVNAIQAELAQKKKKMLKTSKMMAQKLQQIQQNQR
jgi:chemotaxis protein histidine kinase CheA